jgi:hypothetical protein
VNSLFPTGRARRAPNSAIAAVLTVVAVAAVALSACTATYDESLVVDTSPATTSTVPTGGAADLLPILATEASNLANVMIEGGDDQAAAEQIASLWAAARDEVVGQRPDLADGFDQSVAMAAKAVQFKRAADADKAAKNITILVETYFA